MMMSLKETLPSPSRFNASRASAERSMSISDVRKKCGTGPMDCDRRLAMVFRIWVSGTSVKEPELTGAGSRETGDDVAADIGAPDAPARSRRMMRPPGPVPWILPKLMPSSRATRLASGEALMRPAASVGIVGLGAGELGTLTRGAFALG